MKKSILTCIILGSALLVTPMVTGCGGKKEPTEDNQQVESDTTATSHDEMKMDTTKMAYACPMHPEVMGKEGDTCSKCGMKLEPTKTADSTEHVH